MDVIVVLVVPCEETTIDPFDGGHEPEFALYVEPLEYAEDGVIVESATDSIDPLVSDGFESLKHKICSH
jgi:hypothetical protein